MEDALIILQEVANRLGLGYYFYPNLSYFWNGQIYPPDLPDLGEGHLQKSVTFTYGGKAYEWPVVFAFRHGHDDLSVWAITDRYGSEFIEEMVKEIEEIATAWKESDSQQRSAAMLRSHI